MSETSSEQVVSKAKLPPRDAKGRFMRIDTLPPAPPHQFAEEKHRDYAQNAMNIAQEGNPPQREALMKSRQMVKDAQKADLARQRQEQLAKTRAEMAKVSEPVPVPAHNGSKDLHELFEASPFADEKLSGEMVNGQFKAATTEESPGSKLRRLNTEAAYAQGPRVVSQFVESPHVPSTEPAQPDSALSTADSRLSRWIKKLGKKVA